MPGGSKFSDFAGPAVNNMLLPRRLGILHHARLDEISQDIIASVRDGLNRNFQTVQTVLFKLSGSSGEEPLEVTGGPLREMFVLSVLSFNALSGSK